MTTCHYEDRMNRIQDIIFEWEGARLTSRKALSEIKKITNKRKTI